MRKGWNKNELLEQIELERGKLEALVAQLSAAQVTRPGVTDAGWAVKDVLAHLIEWEQMVLGWYATDQRGEKPAIPSAEFNWGQLPRLNQQIFEKHRERPLDDVLAEFHASYRQIVEFVRAMPEEDLLPPGRFAWTGKWAVGDYINSSTASHYRWARNLIRKWSKQQGK